MLSQSKMEYCLLISLFVGLVKTQSFNCYTCTYTLSGDPSVDYECVTSPEQVTKGLNQVNCQAPYLCSTKAVFNKEMTQVRSVSRTCLPQQEICTGDSCCNMAGSYPTCEHKCRSEMCNGVNAETWKKSGSSSGSSNGQGGSGTGTGGSSAGNSVVVENRRNFSSLLQLTFLILCHIAFFV